MLQDALSDVAEALHMTIRDYLRTASVYGAAVLERFPQRKDG